MDNYNPYQSVRRPNVRLYVAAMVSAGSIPLMIITVGWAMYSYQPAVFPLLGALVALLFADKAIAASLRRSR